METKLFIFAAVAISEVFSACEPTATRFENFLRRPRRSVQFTIGAASKKCPGMKEFYYYWQVQQIPGLNVIQTSKYAFITINGYQFNSEECFVKQYLVSLKVSHYPDMSYADETGEIFTFLPDKMHIEILGGVVRNHMSGEDLTLNARLLSTDPSYPPDEDNFAGNTIAWQIEPPLKNFTPPQKLVFTIPGEFLKKPDTSFVFRITVTRNKIPRFIDTQTYAQEVRMTRQGVANVHLVCFRNCILPHPGEVTGYSVECVKYCNQLTYLWIIDPEPKGWNEVYDNRKSNIILLEDTYSHGTEVSMKVTAGGNVVFTEFQFISGLIQGLCEVFPKEGFSLITRFSVTCRNFDSPYGIVLYMIYQIFDHGDVLINENSYKEENLVYLAPGDPATIRVVVQDSAYEQKSEFITLTVKKFYPRLNIPLMSAIKRLVLSEQFDSVTTYSIEGFQNEAIQVISGVLGAIRENQEDKAVTRDLHKHMVHAILRSQAITYASAVQSMLVLARLHHFLVKDDTQTLKLMGKALMESSLTVHVVYCHMENEIPQLYITDFVKKNVETLVNLLQMDKDIKYILNSDVPPHDYDSYDDFNTYKLQIQNDLKNVLSNVLIGIQTNCITVIFKSVPDELPNYFVTSTMHFTVKRRSLVSLRIDPIIKEEDIKSMVILSDLLILELLQQAKFVDVQFGVFRQNPFWWHTDVLTLNTEVMIFDLFIKCRKIRTLETPFYVQLRFRFLPFGEFSGNLSDDASIWSHKIELKPQMLLVVEFSPVPPEYESYLATWSECPCLDEDFISPRTRKVSRSDTPYYRSFQIRGDEKLTYVYMCIKRITAALLFTIRFGMLACLHWDIKREEWDKDGCHVDGSQLLHGKYLSCWCTHVSLFAGQIVIPRLVLATPTEIELTMESTSNHLVFIFIMVLLALWIISLVVAHLRDKFMKKKNIVYKLDDNVPGDSHAYLIVVFTGSFFDAETTANVAFQLIGDKAKSRTHLMQCRGVTFLRRNAQDWFTVYCPFYLGRLKKIRLWHNSKGKNPHWYCTRVIVQDLKTGDQYCFTVMKWFSMLWGGKKYYREIRVNEYSKNIREVMFRTHFEKDLRDNHVWLSIFVRDFQSNFSSKERVSVGFSFLFSSMLITAVLYGIPLGTPTDSIDEKNDYEVDYGNIVIFFEAWVIATALNLLIIFIFNNSAPTKF